jgi:hypothetical protein
LFTHELVAKLVDRDDRPWPEFGKKRAPITSRQVAALLEPFGIKPYKDPLRRGAEHARGYRREDLEDVFARYLSDFCPCIVAFSRCERFSILAVWHGSEGSKPKDFCG